MRYIYAGLGLFCVALGLLGVVLPLLPTVPFLLLATFFFANSSERLHNWIISHPTFGPMILDWRDNGAIRPTAKKAATGSIAAVFLLSLVMGAPSHVLAIQAVVLSSVLIFIWTRPNG
ncbi:YbaN family protein [Phaeobacter sp. QD34_3]|uniref:YbaN family protein n=1 Tax=unclassified Phaeobacter TaxID=2621772 RepID=UPI00237FB526|nr:MULTISPECIES: YbaN family protein [unclassified Phaeobacter]MDE4134729.1 YbaN family protein [Phaeobacter sp. QD34_3]MDE4138407.1 YbaN family protein [Phaeobacter sp. QD34_24]